MQTLDQIKDQVAKHYKFNDWKSLMEVLVANNRVNDLNSYFNEVVIRHTQQYIESKKIVIIGHTPQLSAQILSEKLTEMDNQTIDWAKDMKSIKQFDFETQFLGKFVAQDLDRDKSKFHR